MKVFRDLKLINTVSWQADRFLANKVQIIFRHLFLHHLLTGADPENVQGRGYYKPEAPHLSRLLEAPTCPAFWRPLKSNLSDVRYYMLTLAGTGWGGGGDATLPCGFSISFLFTGRISPFFL